MTGMPEFQILVRKQGTETFLRLNRVGEFSWTQNIEGKSNSGSLKIHNDLNTFYDAGEPVIAVGDQLFFMIRPEPTGSEFTDTTEIKFVGIVKKISEDRAAFSRITVEYSDYTYELLSNVVSISRSDTAPNIISEILENLGRNGRNESIISLADGFPTSRPDGSAFPTVSYTARKSAVEMINDLLSPEWTNTVNELNTDPVTTKPYYWYLVAYYEDNKLEKLYFEFEGFYPADSVSQVFDGRKQRYYRFNHEQSQAEQITHIFYNAGRDLNGSSIQDIYTNDAVQGKGKMEYKPFTELADFVFQAEVDEGNITEDSSGTIFRLDKQWTIPSYPLTPAWPEATSVADIDEYNEAFVEQVKNKAKASARKFVNTADTIVNTIEMPGSFTYSIGSRIDVTHPAGKTFKQRLFKINNSINADRGWEMSLTFKNDKELIITQD